MKRILFLFVLFFIYGLAVSQTDTSKVLKAVEELRAALISKDSNTLKRLLHPAVSFGHSNGWIQSKYDVLNDMKTGYLLYKSFDVQSTEIRISNQYANVREKFGVEGNRGGSDFKMNLFVSHLWVKEKDGWKLLMRQSAKM